MNNVGVEDEENFFSTQERQSIVFHLLYSIRMTEAERINGIRFQIDQSLSNSKKRIKFSFNSI